MIIHRLALVKRDMDTATIKEENEIENILNVRTFDDKFMNLNILSHPSKSVSPNVLPTNPKLSLFFRYVFHFLSTSHLLNHYYYCTTSWSSISLTFGCCSSLSSLLLPYQSHKSQMCFCEARKQTTFTNIWKLNSKALRRVDRVTKRKLDPIKL